MIPLQLKTIVAGRHAPFVVRLELPSLDHDQIQAQSKDNQRAVLAMATRDCLTFTIPDGQLDVLEAELPSVIGDVLLVEPGRTTAQRLIRANSPHNTLLVTERCDQLCVMCSQPPKKTHNDLFDHFASAIELAPEGMTIGLSGGEPTLFKEPLFSLLEKAHKKRPDVQFHILSNAQHFDRGDLSFLRRSADWGICWGIPLYAASEQDHDNLVGKPGAYERLLRSLSVLIQSGSQIELRTVIMRANANGLPKLAGFVATHLASVGVWAIMQLENAGYARNAWSSLFFDSSTEFAPIEKALDIATARGVPVSLYNFPLCSVPVEYRHLAAKSISDWKQKYLSLCGSCKRKQDCAGFFEWYPQGEGFGGLAPL